MEVTVRVISGGLEVDRITRPLRTDGGLPAVIYKKQLWPLEDGCIHIAANEGLTGSSIVDSSGWITLLDRLLPEHLPMGLEECSGLLQTRFRENLPDGVVRAASLLTSFGLEQDARALLIDFLRDKRDSDRLSKLLRMQLLFNERSSQLESPSETPPATGNEKVQVTEPLHEETGSAEWDWTAAEETHAPTVDDTTLRNLAGKIQETMGIHRAADEGPVVPDFESPLEDPVWLNEPTTRFENKIASPKETVLLERTARLGPIGLDLLRYFADNPGDRAAHAQLVLGYPVLEINKLLGGSLGQYLKRDGSGGWECHSWVSNILAALDETQ